MAKHIHIHLHGKARDADIYSEYEKWADVRGKDKRSILTITAFVRATGANPNVENMLRDRYMKTGDTTGKPYEPDEIDRNGKRWEKTEEMIPFNGKPARKYKEKGGYRYITREVESGTVHDAGFTKYDPREATRLDDDIARLKREMAALESKIDVIWKAGGQVTPHNTLQVQYKKLESELAGVSRERAKYHTGDAYRGTFTVEVDADRYDAFVPGREVNWQGLPVKVTSRILQEKKWSGGKPGVGELKPAHVLVTMQTLDGKTKDVMVTTLRPFSFGSGFQVPVGTYEYKAQNGQPYIKVKGEWVHVPGNNFEFTGNTNDSKLEELERQLDALETAIEKLEDAGQSPTRAQLDKRKEIQGAIAVIKSARKTGE